VFDVIRVVLQHVEPAPATQYHHDFKSHASAKVWDLAVFPKKSSNLVLASAQLACINWLTKDVNHLAQHTYGWHLSPRLDQQQWQDGISMGGASTTHSSFLFKRRWHVFCHAP
jgi:hypothetical protein